MQCTCTRCILKMEDFYTDLSIAKEYIISQDPKLKLVFDTVDAKGFDLKTVLKQPYPALVGAIIGQKIRYEQARDLRGKLYAIYGVNFTPETLRGQNLAFLGVRTATIIANVTEYIIRNNVDISNEEGMRCVRVVPGIGDWTIQTALLTSLMNWNLFPPGDKFIAARMRKLYGDNYDLNALLRAWAPYATIVTWYFWRWF